MVVENPKKIKHLNMILNKVNKSKLRRYKKRGKEGISCL